MFREFAILKIYNCRQNMQRSRSSAYFYDQVTGCLKKPHLQEICGFVTLKILPLALALIKPKNRHLFVQLVRKCSKGQFLTNESKRWRFFVLINARANGNIQHLLKIRFLKHLVGIIY